MAPTDARSATATPKILIVATIAFFVVRITAVLVSTPVPAPAAAGIAWQEAASFKVLPPPAQRKLVLYEFYANWSDPCKRMEQTSLQNEQIRDLVQERFVPIRIVDVAHETGRNPGYVAELEKRYRIFALPTLVVVDDQGEPIGSLIGSCSSLTTYRFLTRALHSRGKASG